MAVVIVISFHGHKEKFRSETSIWKIVSSQSTYDCD